MLTRLADRGSVVFRHSLSPVTMAIDNAGGRMPIYRVDFKVNSDLVNPNGADPFVLKGLNPDFKIELRNDSPDENGCVPGLIAVIVASADSLEDATKFCRELLARELDILSFATHSIFKIEQCIRAIDWEPHQKTRSFIARKSFNPSYPPTPELHAEYANTVQTIRGSKLPDYVIRAMKCFRYGVFESQPENQFQNFWFAIEVIAEQRKDSERAKIECPKCKKAHLYCESCETHPERRASPRQAVRQLIYDLAPGEKGVEIDRVLANARNKLLHGSSQSAIEAEVKVPFPLVVNKAGWVAWQAIWSVLQDAVQEEELVFGHRDGKFVRGELIPSILGTFEHAGEAEHPVESRIPTVQISMVTDSGASKDGTELED